MDKLICIPLMLLGYCSGLAGEPMPPSGKSDKFGGLLLEMEERIRASCDNTLISYRITKKLSADEISDRKSVLDEFLASGASIRPQLVAQDFSKPEDYQTVLQHLRDRVDEAPTECWDFSILTNKSRFFASQTGDLKTGINEASIKNKKLEFYCDGKRFVGIDRTARQASVDTVRAEPPMQFGDWQKFVFSFRGFPLSSEVLKFQDLSETASSDHIRLVGSLRKDTAKESITIQENFELDSSTLLPQNAAAYILRGEDRLLIAERTWKYKEYPCGYIPVQMHSVTYRAALGGRQISSSSIDFEVTDVRLHDNDDDKIFKPLIPEGFSVSNELTGEIKQSTAFDKVDSILQNDPHD